MPTYSYKLRSEIYGDTGLATTLDLSWSGLPQNIKVTNVYLSWRGYRSTGSARGRLWNMQGTLLGTWNEGSQSYNISSWYSWSGTSGSIKLQWGAYSAWYTFNDVYINFDYEPAFEESTVSCPNATAGSNHSVTYSNPRMSALKHVFTWTMGSRSLSLTHDVNSTTTRTATVAIPLEWVNAFPNASSMQATLTVQGYNGSTLIFTITKSFTVSAPSSIGPSIESLVADQLDGKPKDMGVYVRGMSEITLRVSGLTTQYGATLSKYIFSGAYTKETKDEYIKTGVVSGTGTLTYYVQAVDSRGFYSNKLQVQVNVLTYANPTITSISAYRCDQDGTQNDSGKYICLTASGSCSSLDSKNALSMTYAWREREIQAFSQEYGIANGEAIIFGGNFDEAIIYVVRATIEDTVGNKTTAETTVQTELYPLHVRDQGRGVAIGQVSQLDDTFEVNADWQVIMRGHYLIDLIYPVGAIYMSVVATNPSLLFGGTWEQIQGRFLIAADDTYAAGSAGGSASHTLSEKEMPAHTHSVNGLTISNTTTRFPVHSTEGSFQVYADQTIDGTNKRWVNATLVESFYSGPKVADGDELTGYQTYELKHSHNVGGAVGSSGNNAAFSTMPPYIAVYMWKRTA